MVGSMAVIIVARLADGGRAKARAPGLGDGSSRVRRVVAPWWRLVHYWEELSSADTMAAGTIVALTALPTVTFWMPSTITSSPAFSPERTT
jgi:hypothetical protein